ncbi:MAG: hypothetical protein ACJ71Q_05415 [Terriglobales bacterium]|jgi:hypothetical protein
MKQKQAQLTAEEERAREKSMNFYLYVGKTDVEASRLAWADVQKEFPRLRNDRASSAGQQKAANDDKE